LQVSFANRNTLISLVQLKFAKLTSFTRNLGGQTFFQPRSGGDRKINLPDGKVERGDNHLSPDARVAAAALEVSQTSVVDARKRSDEHHRSPDDEAKVTGKGWQELSGAGCAD
jgi:hypothetical protein